MQTLPISHSLILTSVPSHTTFNSSTSFSPIRSFDGRTLEVTHDGKLFWLSSGNEGFFF
jgi:hypothetical protein